MALELGVEPQMGWIFLLGMIFMFHRLHRKQGVIGHLDLVLKPAPPPEVAASPGAWGDPQEVQALILNIRSEIEKQKNKTVRIISKSITSHS